MTTQLSLTQLELDPECKWTEAHLAQKLGVTRGKVAQIVNNTNFGEINTLLSQGRDMAYIDLLKDSGWEITHIVDCPRSLRAGGHATISVKHGDPDGKEPNPGSRSTVPDYRKKKMNDQSSFGEGIHPHRY